MDLEDLRLDNLISKWRLEDDRQDNLTSARSLEE